MNKRTLLVSDPSYGRNPVVNVYIGWSDSSNGLAFALTISDANRLARLLSAKANRRVKRKGKDD